MGEKLDWRTIDKGSDLPTAFKIAIEACNTPNAYDGVFNLEYKANYDFGEYGRNKDQDGDWFAEMHLSDFKFSSEAWGNTPQEALLKVTVIFLANKEMRPIEVEQTVDAIGLLDEATAKELLRKEVDRNYTYYSGNSRFNLLEEIRKHAGLPDSVIPE